MTTLPAATHRLAGLPARQRAFTLLEVLIVLVVIGLGTTLVVLSTRPDPRQQVTREAERLADALTAAAQRAQWEGCQIAWQPTPQGYQFWRLPTRAESRAAWEAVTGDDVLGPHRLPDNIRAALLPPVAGAGGGNTAAALNFRPSAQNDPFVVEVQTEGWRVLVSGDPVNRVRVGPPETRS